MSQIQYNLIETDDGQEFLTVLLDGNLMPPIDDSHPNYDQIKGAVVDGDEVSNLADLFDVSATVARKFEKLSERVTVRGGTLFFDGDPIDGTVVETVLRFIDEDKDDWQPLVNYIENIQTNPEEHSRIQLFDWLRHHETISLNEDGLIIAYKGVANGGTHPETGEACWKSTHAGQATVDGININGYIPNYVGATVEMPRSAVMHDPNASCHAGLHVGTFPYAEAYGRSGVMLAVLVNPRDVVSVPHDARGEKIRVARYKVLSVVTEPYEGVLIRTDDEPEPSLPEDDGIDLSFEDAEEQYVPKVGDFVTLDRTKDNFLYIGTITADDNGKLTVERPEKGTGSIKQEWPETRLSATDDTCWYTYPGEGVSLIDDPNAPKVPGVGDFVKFGRSDYGTAFIGTIVGVNGVGSKAITVQRPAVGIGADRNVPQWYVGSIADVVFFEDPNA